MVLSNGIAIDLKQNYNPRIRVPSDIASNVKELNDFLSKNESIWEYVRSDTVQEEITDTALINQLTTICNYLIQLELQNKTYTLSLEDVDSESNETNNKIEE